jgi:hypothetical protein
MAPLRTALTTTALRRATQRFVSRGGKSIAVALARAKISLAGNSYISTLSFMVVQ